MKSTAKTVSLEKLLEQLKELHVSQEGLSVREIFG